MSVIPDNRFGY